MSAASSLVSEIVVTMENNTGKKARTAKLTIKAEGVEGTKVVTIEQASKEDLVVVPYDELVVDRRRQHYLYHCFQQSLGNHSFHRFPFQYRQNIRYR
ncbi:hypothetical protein NXY15_03315 [Bacteroides thetaiotaomicron]|nr:hypothetical protein NXY15_03315 [Bacteroides thetaiotaomicron]